MTAVSSLFWLLEAMPSPAYSLVVQAIYPVRLRGRALGIVRMGMVLTDASGESVSLYHEVHVNNTP